MGEGTGSGAGQACGISSPLAPGAGSMPAAGGMSALCLGGTPARTPPGGPDCQRLRLLRGRVPAACCLPSAWPCPEQPSPSTRAAFTGDCSVNAEEALGAVLALGAAVRAVAPTLESAPPWGRDCRAGARGPRGARRPRPRRGPPGTG